MLLFRIRPRLRPRAVRNGVPNFGRQALVKHKLARANLLSARMKRSTTSAVGTSTRLLLLDFASQERLRVSGAHSPRARWAGRRSSRLFARHLIFSRTLACRHQHPAVPSFDLGSCPRFESPTTINSSNLVLLVITVFCSVLLRLLVWFALVWRVSIVHLLSALISHSPPFLSMASGCAWVSCTHPPVVPSCLAACGVPFVMYHIFEGACYGGFLAL